VREFGCATGGSSVEARRIDRCGGVERKAIVMDQEIERIEDLDPAEVVEDSLLEDVSIDGMCGVY
jgi:mycofactocin precursor